MNTKSFALSLLVVLGVTLCASVAMATDFEWLKELSIRAKADPDGFVAQVAARFEVGQAKVQAVIGNVDSPEDAYMMYRMSEMSGKPVEEVVDTYRVEKKKGWGALAQSLGIKPGSPEFHALKDNDDLYDDSHRNRGGRDDKDKSKGKGKGKD